MRETGLRGEITFRIDRYTHNILYIIHILYIYVSMIRSRGDEKFFIFCSITVHGNRYRGNSMTTTIRATPAPLHPPLLHV